MRTSSEAWVLVSTKPTPSGRRTLLGAGRARILEEKGDRVLVEILRGSGLRAGHRCEVYPADVFPVRDPEARKDFESADRRLWGNGER